MNYLHDPNKQYQSTLSYIGLVTQVNETKDYSRGRKFFARVLVKKSPDTDDYAVADVEMRCMFNVHHEGAFTPEQVIAFEAKKGRGDEGWYTISDIHQVQVLGSAKLSSERKTFVLDYVSLSKARDGREDSSYGRRGDSDWPLELPVSVLEEFFTRKKESGSFSLQDEPAGPGLYGILGTSANADDTVLRRAYRRLARLYHPDVSDLPDATQRFQELQRAYEILKDPTKRKRHDALVGTDVTTLLEDVKFDPSAFAALSGFVPPFRCGRLDVVAQRLGSVWRVERIERWLVKRKSVEVSASLRNVMFESWGIGMMSAKYGDVDIENAMLPFTSLAKWNYCIVRQANVPGRISVRVQLVENARWLKDVNVPVQFWQVEKALSVSLDAAAMAAIEILKRS